MADPTPRLSITSDQADATRLVLVGEIDAHTAPELAGHLDPLPGSQGDVTLDVAEIEFIDSSGLRLIVEAHHRAVAAERRLVVHRPSAAVVRLLEISGLRDHLAVEPD